MKFAVSAFLPALAAAAVLPRGPTAQSDVPDPNDIQIVGSSFSGSGCPQGSVSTNVSPDRTIITFGFDQFQTYIGPGVALQERTKNCALHLNLKYPGGFQFAVVESTYHGFALLEEGITGTFFSTYFFSQDPLATTTTQTSITGGGVWKDGLVYTKQDVVPTVSVIFSPCGATGILNINNRINLTSKKSTAVGAITNDDATVAFTQQINIKWQSCKPKN